MAYRVALLGIYHESNTFINSPTTLDDFRRGHWLVGEAIRKEYQHAHHEIGGMLEVMDRYAIEVVPVLFAEATPGGIVSKDAYFTLTAQMFDGLRDVLPVDGCLVVPHGAGVSEDYPDMDGDWLSKLREIIGPNVPIMGTLDLHANVSKQMIAATDALIAYRQNPHIDQRERGTEAARLMVDCLNGSVRPVQRLVQPPIAISIEQQLTTAEPCKSFYRELAKKDTEKGILAVNVALGFPYADVEEMGTSIWVVADGVVELAIDTANELKSYLLTNRRRFVGKRTNIDVALAEAAVSPKPVLLLDMGDNIGGGGPGNGLSLLAALEDKGILRYCLCIWDPEAVAQVSGLRSAGPFKLTINGDEQNGLEKRQIDVKTVEMVDGKFKEHAPGMEDK